MSDCDFIFVHADQLVWKAADGETVLTTLRGMSGCGDPPTDRWHCKAHGTTILPLNTMSASYKRKFAASPPSVEQCAAEVARLEAQRREWAERQAIEARRRKWEKLRTLPRRLWLTLLGREHDDYGDEWS